MYATELVMGSSYRSRLIWCFGHQRDDTEQLIIFVNISKNSFSIILNNNLIIFILLQSYTFTNLLQY